METTSTRSSEIANAYTKRYVWQAQPINIWVAAAPTNTLQAYVLNAIRDRLVAHGCVFVEKPDQSTHLGPVPHLAIGCWDSYEAEISPLEFLTQMPKPRGQGMPLVTVDHIPDDKEIPFDIARGQLVKKSGHIGIIVEGDADTTTMRRVLWASMPGNHIMLEGPEDEVFDSLALRIMAHIGAEKMTGHDGDVEGLLIWEAWAQSPVHEGMARSARVMGEAQLVEDRVPLEQYGTGKQVRHVLSFLNRAALGEGMRSQIDTNLGLMAVTTSGGGKINLSPDPLDGQIVPIVALTRTGYIRAMPEGCPVTFNAPSVETHENGMVYLASALVNAGLVSTFDEFLHYLDDYFSEHDAIPVIPEGMNPAARVLEHFHRQPVMQTIKEPHKVEVVYPDGARFPEIDFPCGVREAELHLLSALFQSTSFTTPGPLDKVVLAVLPGHGSVAISGGPRDELIAVLVEGMEMESVERI